MLELVVCCSEVIRSLDFSLNYLAMTLLMLSVYARCTNIAPVTLNCSACRTEARFKRRKDEQAKLVIFIEHEKNY